MLLQSLMMPINRVMWSLAGGESESMASPALPGGAQQQGGGRRHEDASVFVPL